MDPLYAAEGAFLPVGSKLLDLKVDLSDAAAHDCPPISYFRLSVRDAVWLRRLEVAAADQCETGTLLALFSTEASESLDAAPDRQIRFSIASIMPKFDWDEV